MLAKIQEFVLKLAKELRSSGASLWVDQLDILGGQRWDEAIQSALTSCEGLLAILSPSAISSQSFMDEVSYALDEGKLVIPVLYQQCDIPFRLRRVQHVDFTKNYDDGLATILRALKVCCTAPANSSATEEDKKREIFSPQSEQAEARGLKQRLKGDRPAPQYTGEGQMKPTFGSSAQTPNTSAETMAAVEVRGRVVPRSLRERCKTSLIGGVAGAIFGTISAFLFGSKGERETWWIGTLLASIPIAIAGAITGKDLRIVVAATVSAIFGTVVGVVLCGVRELILAFVYGAPLGALVGAICTVTWFRFVGKAKA